MMIIPALDLIDGQVVRLFQGDYGQVTPYQVNPVEQFQRYQQAGVKWLHLVDLTGAKDTSARQLDVIAQLLSATSAHVQIGGGVRTEQDVADLLNAGANRVVVGSTAVHDPELVKQWMTKYGAERIVLALDINIDEKGTRHVATSGWQETSTLTIERIIEDFRTVGLKHVLCTDISRDGTLQGSNVELYADLCRLYPDVHFQSSGGIGCLQDIQDLRSTGVSGVIVGKALLEGKFSAEEAMACWQSE